MNYVDADWNTLMRQATDTVEIYYSSLESWFDERYGKGWSKAHSDTVAKMADAAARDFATACILGGIQDLGSEIEKLANAVETIEFPMG